MGEGQVWRHVYVWKGRACSTSRYRMCRILIPCPRHYMRSLQMTSYDFKIQLGKEIPKRLEHQHQRLSQRCWHTSVPAGALPSLLQTGPLQKPLEHDNPSSQKKPSTAQKCFWMLFLMQIIAASLHKNMYNMDSHCIQSWWTLWSDGTLIFSRTSLKLCCEDLAMTSLATLILLQEKDCKKYTRHKWFSCRWTIGKRMRLFSKIHTQL